MSTADLKTRLHDDLTTAIKARDELRTATLRMVLSAITNEEVSGTPARQLSDDEVLKVLAREGKKRREAAEAFDGRQPSRARRPRAGGGRGHRRLPAGPAIGRRICATSSRRPSPLQGRAARRRWARS